MKNLASLLIVLALLLPTLTISAQGGESATVAPPGAPAGIGVLILIMGVLAIGLVGAYYAQQNRPARSQAATPNDEDEDE